MLLPGRFIDGRLGGSREVEKGGGGGGPREKVDCGTGCDCDVCGDDGGGICRPLNGGGGGGGGGGCSKPTIWFR